MSEKKESISNKKLLNLLLELNHRLINISRKIEDIQKIGDFSFEIEEIQQILIPEEVYLELCEEIGEDAMKFMGIS